MLVYIDETGDHNLVNIDSQYPIFGLGALLISEENYLILNKEVEKLKIEFFKDIHNDFILHSSELKRPLDKRSDPRNSVMLNPITRKQFYTEFDKRVIDDIDFKIITCFIMKKRMVDTYKYPIDPYHFSFENLLNRIIRYGGSVNSIYAEKRGEELNTLLMAEYERFKTIGVHSYTADAISTKTNLKLINKKENVAGLQVIDLIMSCLARYGLHKENKMKYNDLTPSRVIAKYACKTTIFPRKQ